MTLPVPYYQDSAVTLYHGDCRAIVPMLDRGLVVTDPPYNIGYHYESYADNLDPEDYNEMLRAVCPEPCVLIHYAEDIVALSWILESVPEKMVAWVYPSNTARQWRSIAWFGCKPDFNKDGQDYKNPKDKRIAERIARGERARLYDWWEINQVKNVSNEKTGHPCQIPLSVMERIIRITESPLVIDPFAGSGTTLLAAKNLGRRAIGVEMDERYCEIIAARISSAAKPAMAELQLA